MIEQKVYVLMLEIVVNLDDPDAKTQWRANSVFFERDNGLLEMHLKSSNVVDAYWEEISLYNLK